MEGDADELEIGFNDKYLTDALKAAPTAEIKIGLTSSITPCIITSTDDANKFLFMILPVRLKAYEG